MNLILNNPFRILDLPITASEKDIIKKVSDLIIFAEMGKSATDKTDFPFFPSFQRTPEIIREASRRIEQPQGRLFYSLFWFWKNSSADESGVALLEEGEIGAAAEQWMKRAKSGTMSAENYSAIKNLTILYIGSAGRLSHDRGRTFLLKGIALAGKIFTADLFESYSRRVTGRDYPSDREGIVRYFADEVLAFARQYADKTGGITEKELLENFRSFPDGIFPYIAGKFTDQPVHRIESEIETVRKKRTDHPYDALKYGRRLYKNTRSDLTYLKNILSHSDLSYQMIADKLANEILQCAIDYFNTYVKTSGDYDPGESALKLASLSASVAVGRRAGTRIEENLFIMETWIKAAPERKRQKEIQLLANDITDQLNSLPDTISSADASRLLTTVQHLFDRSIYKLLLIREYAGANDAAYLKLSSTVAETASGLCMAYAEHDKEYVKAVNFMEKIATLDMLPETREEYNKNRKMLSDKRENETLVSIRSSESPDDVRPCYIATMVYGDENAAEVLFLKKLRDNVLSHYFLGRIFIKTYYQYSPLFVARFKRSEAVNRAIRIFLNYIRRFAG